MLNQIRFYKIRQYLAKNIGKELLVTKAGII
jgi:hypothetical protein